MIQNTELFKRISIETDLAKFSIFLIFDPKKLFSVVFTGNIYTVQSALTDDPLKRIIIVDTRKAGGGISMRTQSKLFA